MSAEDSILIDRIKKRGIEQKRADDQEENYIIKRLDSYRKDTLPILNMYNSEIIIDVNGVQSIPSIHQNILDYL